MGRVGRIVVGVVVVAGFGRAFGGSPAPSGAWSRAAQAGIAAQEYRFAWHDGVLSAPNRAHDLRTRVDENGISIVSRTNGAEAFALELRLTRVERGERVVEPGPAIVVESDRRAELRRRDLTEWLENDARGVEHGLTLPRPPGRGESPVVVTFELGGGLLAYPEGNDGRSILFKDGRGVPVVRYGELAVQDARGASLPARMIVAPGELRIEIDDRGGVYPVTIDPLATSPSWQVTTTQAGALLGSSVSTAGDVNGDGYSDVLVAAGGYDDGQVDEGKVFLYLGGPSGLSTTPAWTAQSNQTSASMRVAAAAGDVNNDGYDDVIVGAPLYDAAGGDDGAAFIWFGGPSTPGNPSGMGADGTPANADWAVYGTYGGENLGYSVARAGDTKNHGFDDVIVGAPGYPSPDPGDGAALVYYGSFTGPSTSVDWIVSFPGYLFGTHFGYSVAGAGDTNGDGFDDVVVGAPNYSENFDNEGAFFLYRGSSSGLSTNFAAHDTGLQEGAAFGWSVAGIGDWNGDGNADVAVGAPLWDSENLFTVDSGAIFFYSGGHYSWLIEGEQDGARLGSAVAAAGDVNGDGYADFLAGADRWDGAAFDGGLALLYLGRAGFAVPVESWSIEGSQDFDGLGDALSGAGDVNGDGYADVLVGLSGWDETGFDNGQARLYSGSAAGLSAAAQTTVTPGQAFAEFGWQVAGAGDINADGFSDVIVGAPKYDNGQTDEGAAFIYLGGLGGLSTTPVSTIEGNQANAQLGYAVAGAGDANGDGYGDVIVGAWLYDGTFVNSGIAFVYYGGFAGLTGQLSGVGQSTQANAWSGYTVAGVGDVNGDGYSDVVIGEPNWNFSSTDEGAVFISYGGLGGVETSVRFGASLGTSFQRMGQVVAAAGDVNGDGYADVLVGMPEFDGFSGGDQGKVFLFLGSSNGLSDTPSSWSPEGTVDHQYFGSSVASAGDVNGDGYADVVVGAPGDDRVRLYLGTPNGPLPFSSWSFQSGQAAQLGNGVTTIGSAGDVNNDGYSDVIVGAPGWDGASLPDLGKTWLFLGSASGLSSTPAWSAVGTGSGFSFGNSVGSGDFNGDGYSDVVIGERYNQAGGNTNQGTVYVFYGNGGLGGKPHPARQANGGDSRNIAPLGITDFDRALTVRQVTWFPAGYDSGHAEVEIKPLGVPFDGTGTVVGFGASSRGAWNSDESITGLAALTPFKWRVRVKDGRNPYFPHTPWFGLADTSRTLTDVRTPCFISRRYQDLDGDGHGNPAVTMDACSFPNGWVVSSDDCDDTNAARFPGNPEVCDGIDNNCDAVVDNAAVPAGSNQISVAKSGLTALISWSLLPGASSYDTVRGSLATLRATGGNYTAALSACLANNSGGPTVSDTNVPPAGDANWYLTRGVNCGGGGSYNEGVASQIGSRDAEIAASSSACP